MYAVTAYLYGPDPADRSRSLSRQDAIRAITLWIDRALCRNPGLSVEQLAPNYYLLSYGPGGPPAGRAFMVEKD